MMIVERALELLPDFLASSSYPLEEANAGAIGVVALALVQAMHEVGLQNPISGIQFRHKFRENDWAAEPGQPNRIFRSDIFLDLSRFSPADRNQLPHDHAKKIWIESTMFLPETNPAYNTPRLLNNLLRLITLVPNSTTARTRRPDDQRYLIHIYKHVPGQPEFEPRNYLSLDRNQGSGARHPRLWLNPLIDPGSENSATFGLIGKDRKKPLGADDFTTGEVKVTFSASSVIAGPRRNSAAGQRFTCILSSIESASLSLRSGVFQFPESGQAAGPRADRNSITVQEHVARWLRSKS